MISVRFLRVERLLAPLSALFLTSTLALAACGDDGAPTPHDVGVSHDSVATDTVSQDGVAADASGLCFPKSKEVPATWVAVKAGTFTMGSPTSEACRDDDEDAHDVTLSASFEISAHEVTQKQFSSLRGYNPSFHTSCDTCPVEFVSWHEAAAYCNALSAVRRLETCYTCTGCQDETRCVAKARCEGFRLPTEAEWEFAARGGATTAYTNGGVTSSGSFCMGSDSNLGKIAWYKINSTGETHPVGNKSPNALGLYDMEGNVYEWTADWYQPKLGTSAVTDPTGPASGTERSFRGGSWYHNAHHARLANRERFKPDKRFVFVGFRCVRTTGSK